MFDQMVNMNHPCPPRSTKSQHLEEFMVFSDTTTSLSPASMETVDAGGLRGGYPAWIINEMIKLDIDPEAGPSGWGKFGNFG